MEAWKGESYDLLSFMYHVCGNKIIVIVKLLLLLLLLLVRSANALEILQSCAKLSLWGQFRTVLPASSKVSIC